MNNSTKTPSYVIFGYKGLLGTAIFNKLCEEVSDFRIFAFDHAHADISNKKHVMDILTFIDPDIVINCAGVNDPDLCERAASGAFEANALGPKNLAEACKELDAKLMHFSSYNVFDGGRYKPYSERCKASPLNMIGKSQAEGEKYIKNILKNHLIIRAGWAFGTDGDNFVKRWATNIGHGLKIYVRPDCHGSPVFVPDLVNAALDLLDLDAKGTFHIANGQATTMESFAETIIDLIGGKKENICSLSRLTNHDIAKTPAYSVLSCKKLSKTLGGEQRPWLAALKQCLFQMGRYKP